MGRNHGPQSKARGADKECDPDASSNRDRESGRACEGSGHEPIGAGSKNWIGGNLFTVHFAVVGGILTQLIDEEKNQLGKHLECVDWYQREAERSRQRIYALEKLRDLMEDARNPDGE